MVAGRLAGHMRGKAALTTYNPRMGVASPHGGTTKYADGCRCDACKAAHAERARHDRMKNPNSRGTVTALPARDESLGDNEIAWIRQCELSVAAERNPSIVAQGRSLATLLDDPGCRAIWPATSRQLDKLRLALAGPRRKSKGRLALVESMTGTSNRAAQ